MQSVLVRPVLEGQFKKEYAARPEELAGMTLVVAATNGREIAAGADTRVYEGDESVYRTYDVPKLHVVNQGRWVIAFSGLGSQAKAVWEYLEATAPTFNPDIRIGVMECIERMGDVYQRCRLPHGAKVLLAGFSNEQPRIYQWDMAEPSPQGGESPAWGAIGVGVGVALHFVRNCEPLHALNLEQLSSLVYFSISEVANSDLRVARPIDVGVIRSTGAEIRSRDSLQHLEEKSVRLARLTRENL